MLVRSASDASLLLLEVGGGVDVCVCVMVLCGGAERGEGPCGWVIYASALVVSSATRRFAAC